MTEFVIQGNLEQLDKDCFWVVEGKELYKIIPTHKSTLIEELKQIKIGSRLKVIGIIKGDKLLCQRATVMLGDIREE